MNRFRFRFKLIKCHRKYCKNKHAKYYIIQYEDRMHSGWTIWQRVVLYGSMYAVEHKMIPVVDMMNWESIYQEKEEYGKVNIWDKYYEQPGGVLLEEALQSGDFLLADPSKEWFDYVRIRKYKYEDNEYLRENYHRYVKLKGEMQDILDNQFQNLLKSNNISLKSKLLGICIRGTDYKLFHHMKQPNIMQVLNLVKYLEEEKGYHNFYIATEDEEILNEIKKVISDNKLFEYKAGELSDVNGYVGEYIAHKKSPHMAAMDYLMVLYTLMKCDGLVGGLCGATIVAQYNRNVQYEDLYIINLNENY